MRTLKTLINSISDSPYQKIHKLTGAFQFPEFEFCFLTIQGSPGANPASIAAIKVSIEDSGLPKKHLVSKNSRLAVADFLIRRFKLGITKFAKQNRGKEGSGSFSTLELSQKMLERDCVLFSTDSIELRFIFSLPATGSGGGRFDAEQAWKMFELELMEIVHYSLIYKCFDEESIQLLDQFIDIQTTRQQIKHYLELQGYCVFINNGAYLPRQSGMDDRPATGTKNQKFQSPDSCQVEISLAGNNTIQGMAIKEGITCITGGGYHGKSTLLQAILAGVYAHIPGDGREYIVTREDAVFTCVEEGRSIRNVDISPFMTNLPNGIDTRHFSTDNASGSTSQATSIVEAFEVGSRFLLFDEDSCANNFLFRDELISKVLDSKNETIRPLYSTLRSMWEQRNVSMIFVMGGLGRFLQKSDCCLLMDHFQCKDITKKVRKELGAIEADDKPIKFLKQRRLSKDNFDPAYTNKRLKKTIPRRIKDLRNAPKQLEYGMDLISLEALPQIVEAPQMLSIGYCLLILHQALNKQGNETKTIDSWIQWLYEQIDEQGIDFLQAKYPGTLSLPRRYELAAAINRCRSLDLVR